MMTFVMSICMLFITCVLIYVVSFVARYVFRSKVEHGYEKDNKETLAIKEPKRAERLVEVEDDDIRNFNVSDEKDVSSLSFRFHSLNSDELVGNIVEEQNAAIWLVQKPHVGSTMVCSDDEMKIYIEHDIISLSPKVSLKQSTSAAKCDHILDNTQGSYFIKEEDWSDSNIFKQKRDFDGDPYCQFETESRTKHCSEFSGFDSDTESLSASDGYSLKDLIADSDGFISERDFHVNVHRSFTSIESLTSPTYQEQHLEYRLSGEGQLQCFHDSIASTIAECVALENVSPHIVNKEISSPNTSLDEHLPVSSCNNFEMKQGTLGQGVANPISAEELKIVDTNDSNDDELHLIKKDDNSKINSDEASSEDLFNQETANGEHAVKETGDVSERHSINQVAQINNHGVNETADVTKSCNLKDNPCTDFMTKCLNVSPHIPNPNKVDGNLHENDTREKQIPRNEVNGRKVMDSDDEDFDALESLWEHQDLLEQLKMELTKVRAIGLPTIFEESESSIKTAENLKPWKIDAKFLHDDPMDELHAFYKSYRERMRKFDVLNYQKMYAIGFLQLKDPLQSIANLKNCIPSILFRNCTFGRKSSVSPIEQFIKELRNDLELVYVGQTCLSWEFLCWQYDKARELPEYDPYRGHCYNHVAGEFQQFQVVLQRFIEDEECQGYRLENYVKNRCVLRNLIQVPVMKEDIFNHEFEDPAKGDFLISKEMLEDIMVESIKIFWNFVKADKDETPVFLKGFIRSNVELQEPSDLKFMLQIQSNLQKKEKNIKDIQRSSNCIVKKFKKPKVDRLSQDLLFSQIDLKLVARVLRMTRITTDQLVWCQHKLSKIMVVDRKIYRNSSFCLFPC